MKQFDSLVKQLLKEAPQTAPAPTKPKTKPAPSPSPTPSKPSQPPKRHPLQPTRPGISPNPMAKKGKEENEECSGMSKPKVTRYKR